MEEQLPLCFTMQETIEAQKKEQESKVDITFGLQCRMNFKEFCEMKATNPNWKGNK